jgi:ATP-binding protein involved in chromosome partitioning
MSHFTCPHCQEVIDIFSSGGAERTAQQYGLEFLGTLELDPSIRKGGDSGLPVAVAGPESVIAAGFYEIARKVATSAIAIAGRTEDVLEIS